MEDKQDQFNSDIE